MRRIILALLLLGTVPAFAETQVSPAQRSTSFPVNGTITSGNAFQSIMSSDTNRTACIIQNTSTHTMYFYVGATADATTAKSLQVSPGGAFYCTNSVITVTDNVAVTTSTTSDTFAGFFQH